jgi:putative transposase
MSQDRNHLNHATWECKYHVVFTPKYRKKLLFGQIRRHLGTVFHELARRKECKIEEGHLMPDHVHILISIPPKYSVAEVIGYLKGKSSIWIAQNIERKLRNFLVGVPGRGVGAEGGALHGGRPEGRPEGNALEAFSPGCPQRHRRGGAVMVRIEVGSGCETKNATKRANHDDRQNGLNGPD